MLREIDVLSHYFRCLVAGVNNGPMTIELFFERGPSLANILYTPNPAGDNIDDITCYACDVTFCLKDGSVDVTCKGI